RMKRLSLLKDTDSEIIHVGSLSVNLATYQVKVNDAPIDLTYMEYELLSFLVQHGGRTYSREVLLSQVWGFDYYGGSRTVDVHIRRLRAKLGPEVAQHIETIRGAGYLWNT
ncbi:MAG: winged helix-turn-helix transcriptional regulator, partial [Eggerthellaceae bacterium]|nr:winged helix-turn-helix transcriptional regulator [Eggerthellaceae bacterium]